MAQDKAATSVRDMIFLSHANPEDNEFTRWLALQLAKDGYPVWCDLTQLLGGENFWKDAETAIRSRTIKFLYVLSRTSNEKDGPRRELQIALNVARKDKSLHDFVIPLHIDDLPHGDINVLLTSLNAVPFEKSWAKGYQQLLELLERENVPKNPNFNPSAVSTWWRAQFSADRGVQRKPDRYLSNWLKVVCPPQYLFLHTLVRTTTGAVEPQHRLPFAGFMDNIDLVTFASADDMKCALGESVSIIESNRFCVSDLLTDRCALDTKKSRYFLARLLRDCWERWIGSSAMGLYTLSSRSNCYFFKKGSESNLDIRFTGVDGKKTYRSVVGYATNFDGSRRYWHFGVRARPVMSPFLGYMLTAHVILTDDGATPWDSPSKMHRARRRLCKSWFNPEWRDRLMATLHWLSQGATSVRIPAGSEAFIEVATNPVELESPVSYVDPPTRKERLLLAEATVAETETELVKFGDYEEDEHEDDEDLDDQKEDDDL
jgi:hypothetical protein